MRVIWQATFAALGSRAVVHRYQVVVHGFQDADEALARRVPAAIQPASTVSIGRCRRCRTWFRCRARPSRRRGGGNQPHRRFSFSGRAQRRRGVCLSSSGRARKVGESYSWSVARPRCRGCRPRGRRAGSAGSARMAPARLRVDNGGGPASYSNKAGARGSMLLFSLIALTHAHQL